MSTKKYKAQASSARAALSFTSGFGGTTTAFQTHASLLAYVTEGSDLTQISHPNVVVAFKNLSKKDSTTKAKALEELSEYCSSQECEQAVLTAWCDTYPRTSIDNSRKVRQLAHTIQGTLTASCGKRVAPLLSKVVGSWLAGTYDSDKVVARTAQDSLERSFPTSEKRRALWKIYQEALVQYTEDAVLTQTEHTLSDERTTSPDEAEAKYVRVVGGGLHILAQLLEDNTKLEAAATFLSEKKLWGFITHNDQYLRRGLCQLLRPVCKTYSHYVDWKVVSSSFLSKGLPSNQIGSSIHFTEALILATDHHAEIWTTDYISKTTVAKRLHQFLSKGSQSGPDRVWPAIRKLLELIPLTAWLSDEKHESTIALMQAVRTGVCQPSERAHAMTAWANYVDIAFWLLSLVDDRKDEFANATLVPILLNYVNPTQRQHWPIPTNAARLCASIMDRLTESGCVTSATKMWTDVLDATRDAMKMSLPESAKDFRSSQDAVVAQANRLFQLRNSFLDLIQSHTILTQLIGETQLQLLHAALDLLSARNGKPYAAASIANAIARLPGFDVSDPTLQEFITNDVIRLIESPSAEQSISLTLAAGRIDIFEKLLKGEGQTAGVSSKVINLLLKHATDEQLSSGLKIEIQDHIIDDLATAASQDAARLILFNQGLKSMQDVVLGKVQHCLSVKVTTEAQAGALAVLTDALSLPNSEHIISTELRRVLLSELLVLSDSATDLAEQARILAPKLDAKTFGQENSQAIIQEQHDGEGTPLAIFTVIDLAISGFKKGLLLSSILPTQGQWQKALDPLYACPRPYDLAVTNPLQGVIYCLRPVSEVANASPRDSETLSLAFRLALYTTKLLNSTNLTSPLDSISTAALQYLPIVMEMINEKLTCADANTIWLQSSPELIQEAADVLSDGNRIIQAWLDQGDACIDFWMSRGHLFEDSTISTYCQASAWINVVSQAIDRTGPSQFLEQYEQDLQAAVRAPNIVQAAAVLAVSRDHLSTSAVGKRLTNELVASATEAKSDLQPLILLNILVQGQNSALEAIPNQRLVFLLKNIVDLLQQHDVTGLAAECVKLLSAIVPLVADLYGEHWDMMLEYINLVWQTEAAIPLINSSLRLYNKLIALSQADDPNEDLVEAIKAKRHGLDDGLLHCLVLLSSDNINVNQPRDITADLLERSLRRVIPKDSTSLFHLLNSRVEAVQNAVFALLHRTIPDTQEQLSIDVLLEKKVAHLPGNLLSQLEDSSHAKQYLLAWNLVFDHFSKASYVLREYYISDIKEGGQLNGLLNFICDIIRITSGRPIDASKVNFLAFSTDGCESLEKELQHLSIYAYYNVLLFTPSLAKEWFISQKNRVKTPLESWTQKFISPSIVATSVLDVTTWAATQVEDERPLEVKPSPRGTELVASIEIDPENPPISLAITLPGSYPFESPSVISRTRVGVSEKNWLSWLRTFQIIIFSTGSIVEGLIAFRHNVQGALKGQSECAICYSIIGTDKQTPNKKCNTCKNTFHGSCLFRWFKSSNSSSCPLCRNNFNYA